MSERSVSAAEPARSAAEREWEQWRADRLRALRAPQGNLALVGDRLAPRR